MYGENDTPYVKTSRKITPTKADHRHEYVRAVTYMRIVRSNGALSAEKYRFTAPDECIICGHRYVGRNPNAVEVEVSPAEFRKIKNI